MIPPKSFLPYGEKPESALVYRRAVAAGCVALALIALSIIALVGGFIYGDSPSAFWPAAVAFASALAAFIVGQLMHLRAALYSLDEREEAKTPKPQDENQSSLNQ
jgi:uncharacterized membrane protein YdjX (TVP38/TMEM64 family)